MSHEPVFYVDGLAGELICRDHYDADAYDENDDDAPSPVAPWSTSEWEAVQFCPCGPDHGHAFCTSCGASIDDEDFIGHGLVQCGNCRTSSVYVDGRGYVYVDDAGRWDRLTDAVIVDVETYNGQAQVPDGCRVLTVLDDAPACSSVELWAAWYDDGSRGCALVVVGPGTGSAQVTDAVTDALWYGVDALDAAWTDMPRDDAGDVDRDAVIDRLTVRQLRANAVTRAAVSFHSVR